MDVAGSAMVRRAYSLTARSLGTMVAPVAAVMVPLVLVALWLPAVGGGIVVLVNGDFALIDGPSVAWAAGATVVAGALVAGATVVTSIGVIMAAGVVVGRRVSVRAAVTLAARRAVRLASAVVAAWSVTAGVLAACVTAGQWFPNWIGREARTSCPWRAASPAWGGPPSSPPLRTACPLGPTPRPG
jgi:hypothetical protein